MPELVSTRALNRALLARQGLLARLTIRRAGRCARVLMRSTVHLVTARDCLALRPLVAPMLERQLMTGSPWGRALVGMDLDGLVAAGREILEQQAHTNPELARRLAQL